MLCLNSSSTLAVSAGELSLLLMLLLLLLTIPHDAKHHTTYHDDQLWDMINYDDP